MPASERFIHLDQAKQQKILAAAVEEFAEQGFMQASMNRVVQKLGIAKGSLFQYFGTKEGLFRFIFEHAVELVRQSLRQVKRDTAEADFFLRMRRSLAAGVAFIDRHPLVYQIYLKMIFQEKFPYRAEFLQQVHLFSAEYLTPLVEAGIARGELRADLDIETTVFLLDAVLDRFLQAYSVPFLDAGMGIYRAGEDQVKERIERVIEVLRQGLGSSEAEPAPRSDADQKGSKRRHV